MAVDFGDQPALTFEILLTPLAGNVSRYISFLPDSVDLHDVGPFVRRATHG